jgi:hypothetical protein
MLLWVTDTARPRSEQSEISHNSATQGKAAITVVEVPEGLRLAALGKVLPKT